MNNIYKPKQLMHITTKSPNELNGFLLPKKNTNMYKEDYDYYVFATSRKTASKAYYFLKRPCMHMFSYTENNVFVIIKNYQEYKIAINGTSYIYKIPSDTFLPVVKPNNEFGGEWVSKSKIDIRNCDCKNIEFVDVIEKNEFGNAVDVFVCNNIDIYQDLREKIKKIENYYDKYLYLNSLPYEEDKQFSKVKVFGK